MDTINGRINYIVSYTGLSKTAFAKEINLTQSMVSKLCSGTAVPSDRTVSDICRVFHINEDWLLYGDGEMINLNSKEAALSRIFCDLNMCTDVKNRLIKAFAKVPEALYPEAVDLLDQTIDVVLSKRTTQSEKPESKENVPDATNIQD